MDPGYIEGEDASKEGREANGGVRTFSDLQEALLAAGEGDVVFLEPGFYYREEVRHPDI